MKCKKCKNQMQSKEFMADWDAENTKILRFYHCEECRQSYDLAGRLIHEE